MSFRSFVAFLILVNYLLLAVIGCITKPEQDRYMLMIKTDSDKNQQYEECRYLRMDGLEAFMEEAMATRYSNSPDTHKNHLISVVNGIDTHFLPEYVQIPLRVVFQNTTTQLSHPPASIKEIALEVYCPPDNLLIA